MVFKCSKCRYTSANYAAMQKHYARVHPNKTKVSIPKGKQKKVYVYHGPPKKRRR